MTFDKKYGRQNSFRFLVSEDQTFFPFETLCFYQNYLLVKLWLVFEYSLSSVEIHPEYLESKPGFWIKIKNTFYHFFLNLILNWISINFQKASFQFLHDKEDNSIHYFLFSFTIDSCNLNFHQQKDWQTVISKWEVSSWNWIRKDWRKTGFVQAEITLFKHFLVLKSHIYNMYSK